MVTYPVIVSLLGLSFSLVFGYESPDALLPSGGFEGMGLAYQELYDREDLFKLYKDTIKNCAAERPSMSSLVRQKSLRVKLIVGVAIMVLQACSGWILFTVYPTDFLTQLENASVAARYSLLLVASDLWTSLLALIALSRMSILKAPVILGCVLMAVLGIFLVIFLGAGLETSGKYLLLLQRQCFRLLVETAGTVYLARNLPSCGQAVSQTVFFLAASICSAIYLPMEGSRVIEVLCYSLVPVFTLAILITHMREARLSHLSPGPKKKTQEAQGLMRAQTET